MRRQRLLDGQVAGDRGLRRHRDRRSRRPRRRCGGGRGARPTPHRERASSSALTCSISSGDMPTPASSCALALPRCDRRAGRGGRRCRRPARGARPAPACPARRAAAGRPRATERRPRRRAMAAATARSSSAERRRRPTRRLGRGAGPGRRSPTMPHMAIRLPTRSADPLRRPGAAGPASSDWLGSAEAGERPTAARSSATGWASVGGRRLDHHPDERLGAAGAHAGRGRRRPAPPRRRRSRRPARRPRRGWRSATRTFTSTCG